MGVACGIVGLPNCGKSTLFNAFTKSTAERAVYPFSTTEAQEALVDVPDDRLERIHRLVKTEKVIAANVRVVDIPGLAPGASTGKGLGNKFLGAIKECDAILQVVRCFESADVVRETPLDPAGDIGELELELAMADLDTVSRAVERVAKKARTGDKEAQFEQELFERAKALLEEGQVLRGTDWDDRESDALRQLFLITMKPFLYVANIDQEDLAGESAHAQAVRAHAEESGSEWVHLCGDLECELVGMDDADRTEFMGEFGVEELSLPRLIRATYGLLGLQTFFTAGPKEIRAWTIRKGDTGPIAAGVIHTDFEKGYVRAEVYSVDDLEEHEDEPAIKAAGKMRIEGRDYVMQESDVAHFLVNR
jgi:hypothetical protein